MNCMPYMKLNPHLPKIIEALRENEGQSHPRDIRGAVDELEHMARRIDALEELAERLTAERDEARRLLKAVVDMVRDNMAPDATHPKHLCDFINRPDIAMCKVCEDWTDAMVMCYPDDFQDEEDGK